MCIRDSRSSAEAPTTIVPASVEDAPDYSQAPRKKAARKKKAAKKKKAVRKKKAARKKEAAAKAKESGEAATTAVEAPANGRRKKKGKKKAAKKKKAGKKKAATGRGGRQPFPDRQTLKATDGDATAEIFRLDGKWYLNVDGTEVGDGDGWTSRKQALEAAAEVLGEYEVIS